MSVLVVGSVAFDTVRTPFGEVTDQLGGSATFFAASASFLTNVQVVAVVGEDFDKETQLGFLESRGVDLSGIEVRPGRTFRWSGDYGADLNEARTLSTELNVFEAFRPRLSESQRKAPVVFLANIQPQLQLEVLEQMESPRFVAADTMNLWITRERDALLEVLRRVDMVTINESEARLLAGEANTIKAAAAIHEMGPRTVVVKRGEYGALMFTEGNFFFVPAYPLESVFDPTGAGDTFAGGLVGTIARAERDDLEALRAGVVMGSVLASFDVEQFGLDRMKSLSWREVIARYQTMRQLTWFEHLDWHHAG